VQLTKHTDFGLRALLYLALNPGHRTSVTEIARVFGVPKSHLTKVATRLAAAGIVRTYRGKGGGIALAMPPAEIRIGAVVRELEGQRQMIDCERPKCPAMRACRLRDIMREAQTACLGAMDNYALSDVIDDRRAQLESLLAQPIETKTRESEG